MKLDWTTGPLEDETSISIRQHWCIEGSEARVIECRPKLRLPRCFYAVATMARMISRHRTKAAAKKAVELFLSRHSGEEG